MLARLKDNSEKGGQITYPASMSGPETPHRPLYPRFTGRDSCFVGINGLE